MQISELNAMKVAERVRDNLQEKYGKPVVVVNVRGTFAVMFKAQCYDKKTGLAKDNLCYP